MREERPRERNAAHAKKRALAGPIFTGHEHTASVRPMRRVLTKGSRKADHVYTNDDVTRQNDKKTAR